MELRHLRYFVAVAEEGHVTRAAARLGLGQPPLSQQIRDLEREVGTPLFKRLPRGVALTEAGVAFLADARRSLAAAAQGAENARRAARGEIGTLRLGFTGSMAFNLVVTRSIRLFRRRHKEVTLVLRQANTMTLREELLAGDLDAVFMRPPLEASAPAGLEAAPLGAEPLMAALPSSHPLAAGLDIQLPAIANEPFLLFPREVGPGLYDAIVATCRMAGFEPKRGQEAPQLLSIIALVAAELGVALVPRSMAQLHLEGVRILPVAGGTAEARYALARRAGDDSVFQSHLRAIVNEVQAGLPD